MKKLTLLKLSASILGALIIGGCATTGDDIQATWNKINAEKKAPVRLIKDDSFSNKDSIRLIEGWAGVSGKSAINEKYQEMAFEKIQHNCGYSKEDHIETRIVNHSETSWEEVWLFNDPKSFRDDKVSGLTAFFQYDPKTNQTNVQFFGSCHTGKGNSFVFS